LKPKTKERNACGDGKVQAVDESEARHEAIQRRWRAMKIWRVKKNGKKKTYS
jgi:hypothetical protein